MVNMIKNGSFFYSLIKKKQITYRKINEFNKKIKLLSFQWSDFKKEQPFKINYKYSNNS